MPIVRRRPVPKARPPAGESPIPAGEKEIPELAREPNLVDAIPRDIALIGLVGEALAALLVYLVYSSRKLRKPLHAIIRGASGSGKDQVQRRPAELMPPEDVIEATSMTPQALYYGGPDWLRNKIILGGERKHEDDDAARDGTAAIRQMKSEGMITKQAVVEGKTESIVVNGPVSHSETTTKETLFPEDLNRCLQVATDPSQEQTRAVMRASAAGPPDPATVQAVRDRHHEFQRSLEALPVEIPFAGELAEVMPTSKIEMRRVFQQVPSLIEVITYVHQHSRTRTAAGGLVATADDYELARLLVLGPLHASVGLGKDHAKCAAFAAKLPEHEFDSAEALKVLSAETRKVAHDWLKKLVSVGVIKCVAAGVGNRPARWRKTGKSVDEALLPSVATIRAACVSALPRVS